LETSTTSQRARTRSDKNFKSISRARRNSALEGYSRLVLCFFFFLFLLSFGTARWSPLFPLISSDSFEFQ
jgi:hypothetical protein